MREIMRNMSYLNIHFCPIPHVTPSIVVVINLYALAMELQVATGGTGGTAGDLIQKGFSGWYFWMDQQVLCFKKDYSTWNIRTNDLRVEVSGSSMIQVVF